MKETVIETGNIDREIARKAAADLEVGIAELIEPGMDDSRSPAQIRRDAEKNDGNPRMPGLDRGIGSVAVVNANTIPAPDHRPE